LSRFNVEVPILWFGTGNLWVHFELMKRLEKNLVPKYVDQLRLAVKVFIHCCVSGGQI